MRKSRSTIWSKLVEVRNATGDRTRRRGRALNVMLFATALAGGLITVVILILLPTDLIEAGEEVTRLYIGVGVALIAVGLVYLVNRFISQNVASLLYLTLLTGVNVVADRPDEVVNGRSLFGFAIPIFAASVLFPPWASFVAAGVCSGIIGIIGITILGQPLPNIPAMLSFFVFALIAYLSGQNLEHMVRKLRSTNRALEASEERFRRSIMEAPVPIMIHAEGGEVIEINRVWTEITGYTDDDIPTIEHWVHKAYGENEAEVLPKIERLYELDRRISEGEFTVTTRSGERRKWAFNSAPLGHLPDGRRLVISMAIDVTERKAAEKELQLSEQRYRTIFETTGTATVIIEPDTTISLANSQFTQLSGYSRDEIEGKTSWTEFVAHEDDLAKMRRYHKLRRSQGGAPSRYEFTFVDRDGTEKAILLDIALIPGTGQSVAALLNISERKAMEEQLRQRVTELSTLHSLGVQAGGTTSLKSTVHAILEELTSATAADVTALLLKEDERIVLQGTEPDTTRFREIGTGIEHLGECLCGTALQEGEPVYAFDLHTDPRCTLSECKEAGLQSLVALPLKGTEGIIGCLALGSLETHDFERQAHFLETVADRIGVTLQNTLLYDQVQRHAEELEQRVAERTSELNERMDEIQRLNRALTNLLEDLQAANQNLAATSERLKDANKELEAFAYSVSHDLRAPLRAINGFSRILLEDYAPDLPSGAQRYLNLVQDNATQMGQLIDDLLTFSRLSRRSVSKQEIQPGALVIDALEELQQETEGRVVEIEIDDLPPCRADPGLLTRVYVNLLSNALKFTRERDPAQIEVGCRRENGLDVYFVSDNGVGFNMEYADKLFGVFQRLHRAEDYEGTGVGLAIVRRIVHRHGGRVWAESKVDKGATFYFTLEPESD